MSGRVFICVTGMPGAGKSIISGEIARALKAPLIIMGDVVREEASRRGVGRDLKSMMDFARRLREELGPCAVAELTLRKVNSPEFSRHKVLVIDGVRSLDEIGRFESAGKVIVVAVHASPRRRFERLVRRGRPDDPKTWEEFRERDYRELSFGIGSVIALADVMVVNEHDDVSVIKSEAVERVLEELRDVPRRG